MASRVCSCGSPLADDEGRLRCPGCGAEARAWGVVDADGRLVAAATRDAIVLGDELAAAVIPGEPAA